MNYAPGFAVAVAIAEEAAGDRLVAARIVNAVCLAAIVILGWALLRIHVGSVPLRLAGVAGGWRGSPTRSLADRLSA